MTLQKQPSVTSCGPTSVAMVVDVPATEVLARLPSVRTRRRQDDKANMGELRRLLNAYGWTLGPRQRGQMPRGARLLGRYEHQGRTGWHWFAVDNRVVFDPCSQGPVKVRTRWSYADPRLSWYRVTPAMRTAQ